MFLYYNQRKLHGSTREDRGASVMSGLLSLHYTGVCHESCHSYTTQNLYKRPSFYSYISARNNRCKTFYSVSSNVDAIKRALQIGMIITGIYVDDSFELTGKLSDNGEDGHAVVIYGYTEEAFLARNSWSKNWNKNGNFEIPFDYMHLLADTHVLVK